MKDYAILHKRGLLICCRYLMMMIVILIDGEVCVCDSCEVGLYFVRWCYVVDH